MEDPVESKDSILLREVKASDKELQTIPCPADVANNFRSLVAMLRTDVARNNAFLGSLNELR